MKEVVEDKSPSILLSNRSLADNIGRNTLFSIVANVVFIGTRLVTVPIVIGHLGLDGYGIWSIIMAITAYMRLGSMGIKSAFQKYVAEATGTGDWERASRLLSTGCVTMLALSLIGLTPVAIYSRSLAYAVGVPSQFLSATAGAITLLAITMMIANSVGAVYEAIIMGGHRIDVIRTFNIVSSILEALAVVLLLHFGYGLLAMSVVVALANIGYFICCYTASAHVLPALQISAKYLTRNVLRELVTYAGSYQLVSILEVAYNAILPLTVLKFFGADVAGAYAVAGRLITAALLPQLALLLPILSSGSVVFASGSVERMQLLLSKAYKATLTLTVLPLALVAVWGTTIILVWTGQPMPSLYTALWLMCLAGLFSSLASLGRILYRITGKSLIDNIQHGLMLAVLLAFSVFGNRLGFLGILAGLAVAEFVGMICILAAVVRVFRGVSLGMLLPDTLKSVLATVAILVVSAAVVNFPVPWSGTVRFLATMKLGTISLMVLLTTLPSILLFGVLSRPEIQVLMGIFRRKIVAHS